MRILGIDYGTKRVGVAMSDEAGQFAMPLVVLKNGKDLIGEICGLLEENSAKEVVLGESKNYKGEDNAIMKAGLELKKSLEAKGFVVHLEPEFMTSVEAERFQGKNEMSDASAAAIILQSYLDKKIKN